MEGNGYFSLPVAVSNCLSADIGAALRPLLKLEKIDLV